MKKLLGMFVLLFAVLSSRAAFPVFLGATTDYITNSGPSIIFVYSNRVVVTFTRGNGNGQFANGVTLLSPPGGTLPGLRIVDTNGNVSFWSSTNASGVLFLGSNGLTGTVTFSNNPTTTNFSIQAGAATLSKTRWTPAGFGIGTNTPVYQLQVFNPSAAHITHLSGAGSAVIVLRDNTGSTDNKAWRFGVQNDRLALSVLNDAESAFVIQNIIAFRTNGNVGFGVQMAEERIDVLASGQFGSNVVFTNLSFLAATNGSANTNITVDYNQAVTDLYLTNNASFTNHSGLAATKSKSATIFITPMLVNRTIVWPTLGAPGFGTYWYTNAFSPMWTTLTSGVTYALSLTTRGTNVHASMTEWK